jgi:hypothetical protein
VYGASFNGQTAWDAVISGWQILITLDELIARNETLQEHWHHYKLYPLFFALGCFMDCRLITQSIANNAIGDARLDVAQRMILRLDRLVFDGKIFRVRSTFTALLIMLAWLGAVV